MPLVNGQESDTQTEDFREAALAGAHAHSLPSLQEKGVSLLFKQQLSREPHMQDRVLPSRRPLQSHLGAVGATVRPSSQTGTQAEGGLAACRLLSWQRTILETHCPSVPASSFSTRGSGGLENCPKNDLFNPVLSLPVKGTLKNQEKPGQMVLEVLFQFFIYLCFLHCPDQASCLPHRITEICWQHVSQLCRLMSALGNICARPGRPQPW